MKDSHWEINPSHERIATLAEKFYRDSGSIPGRDEENWFRAETQLRQAASAHSETETAASKNLPSNPSATRPESLKEQVRKNRQGKSSNEVETLCRDACVADYVS